MSPELLTSDTDEPTNTSASETTPYNTSIEATSQYLNVTAPLKDDVPTNDMNAGTGVGIAVAVILLLIACVLVFVCLKKTGRLKLFTIRGRPRRSSTSSSRHPLEPDDAESVDNLPRLSEGDMFAIADPDEERDDGTTPDDGYFYDEVFGSSAFEDETTKASNKNLYSATEADSIPDLLLRVDRITFN